MESFVKDVICTANTFYKHLNGDEYIGMRSDCESFLSDMQRKLYLVRFTLKEEMKSRITESVTDSDEYIVENTNGNTITLSESELNNLINFSIARTILIREGRNGDEKYKIRKEIKAFIQSGEVYDVSDYLEEVADLVGEHIHNIFNADMSHWGKEDGTEEFEITTLHGDKVVGYFTYSKDDGEVCAEFQDR